MIVSIPTLASRFGARPSIVGITSRLSPLRIVSMVTVILTVVCAVKTKSPVAQP